jgi:glycosyltransferase involved in cell wall biosynthesis
MSTIAMMHYAGPPGIGGVEVTMQQHAQQLAHNGHHVQFVVGAGQSVDERVELLLNPLFGSRGTTIETANRKLAEGIIDGDFRSLVTVTRDALSVVLEHTDAILVHNILSLHKNLALTAALRELHDQGLLPPLIAWCHDFAWLDPLYQPDLHAGWPWDLLREPWPNVRYVVVSDERRTMFNELFGELAQPVEVIPPGIDLPGLLKLESDTHKLVERQNLLDAQPLLLLPARITRRKNIEQAVAIMGALLKQAPKAKLVVTGPPGPHNPSNAAYLAQLEELSKQHQATNAICFLYREYTNPDGSPKPVSDAMVADLYKLADGLLFPSSSEGFGIPILEAAIMGLPIFCSDIAPFRASAKEAALYFDPQGDPQVIAQQIFDSLVSDQRTRLRQQVRQTATWDAIYHRQIAPLLQAIKR